MSEDLPQPVRRPDGSLVRTSTVARIAGSFGRYVTSYEVAEVLNKVVHDYEAMKPSYSSPARENPCL